MTFVAGGALKPIGGHILSHASATRMFLRKGELSQNQQGLMTTSWAITLGSNHPNKLTELFCIADDLLFPFILSRL